MFHNNYRVYKTNFDEFDIEVEYINEITNKVQTTHIKVNNVQMLQLLEILDALDFDDRTPEEGE